MTRLGTAPPEAQLSRKNKVGLGLAGLLGLPTRPACSWPRREPGEIGPPLARF